LQTAKQIINQVSDQASWDEFYVKQKIKKGLKAVEDGHTRL
jgi:hypothetical protein